MKNFTFKFDIGQEVFWVKKEAKTKLIKNKDHSKNQDYFLEFLTNLYEVNPFKLTIKEQAMYTKENKVEEFYLCVEYGHQRQFTSQELFKTLNQAQKVCDKLNSNKE